MSSLQRHNSCYRPVPSSKSSSLDLYRCCSEVQVWRLVTVIKNPPCGQPSIWLAPSKFTRRKCVESRKCSVGSSGSCRVFQTLAKEFLLAASAILDTSPTTYLIDASRSADIEYRPAPQNDSTFKIHIVRNELRELLTSITIAGRVNHLCMHN